MSPSAVGPRLDIRILDEVAVSRGGRPVHVPRGLGATVLFLLALDPGVSVSDDRLIDRLWIEPPPTALQSLRNTITRLRAVLGEESIERTPNGYRLDASRCMVDLEQVRRVARETAGAPAALRAAQLRAVLGDLIRSVPVEFTSMPWASSLGRQIEEEFLAIEDAWAAAALETGPTAEDVTIMGALVQRAPLREQRWALLIDALCAVGRRAEALRVIEQARSRLLEVGLDPAVALLAAERRALAAEADPERDTRRELIAELRSSRGDDLLLLDAELSAIDAGGSVNAEFTAFVEETFASLLSAARYEDLERVGGRWYELVGRRSGVSAASLGAQIHLASAMIALGRSGEGLALLEVAEQRGRLHGLNHLEADALLARGPIDTGSPTARVIADRAEEVLARLGPEDLERRVRLATWAAHHRAIAGDRFGSRALLAAVEAEATAAADPALRSLVLLVGVQIALLVGGSPAEFRSSFDRLDSWARLTGDLSAVGGVAVFRSSATLLDGAPAGLEESRAGLGRVVVELPRPDLRWMAACLRATGALLSGDPSEEAIVSAEELGRELQVASAAVVAGVQRIMALYDAGTLGALAPLLRAEGISTERAEMAAAWGLAAAMSGDSGEISEAIEMLLSYERPLRSGGVAWPLMGLASVELSMVSGDDRLAFRCADELAPWSGTGLSLLGVCYLGSADGLLGVFHALLGNRSTAAELLDRALQFETRLGAAPFVVRTKHWIERLSM